MRVLILVEHDNHQIHASTSQVLAAALLLDKTPTACVIGYGCQGVAESVASLKGVQSVIMIDHADYEHGLSENISQAVVAIAAEFEAILAAATTYGKNILPRVAALLDTAQISDVTRVINQDTFEHPIYAGHAIETVQVLDEKKILIGYTKYQEFFSPNYSDSVKSFAPDARTTLYWNPYILTNSKSPKVQLEFYNNDISKRFRVVLEGINADGKLAHIEKIIE